MFVCDHVKVLVLDEQDVLDERSGPDSETGMLVCVCLHACMYVCIWMYVCMYVCMHKFDSLTIFCPDQCALHG
jgi:hypothetical protein